MRREIEYHDNDYEIIITTEGEERTFIGKFDGENPQGYGFILYSDDEIERLNIDNIVVGVPFGDVAIHHRGGYVAVLKNDNLIDMIPRNQIQSIKTFLNGLIIKIKG